MPALTIRPAITKVSMLQLADLLDACADSDGQWNGGDVSDALATLVNTAGGFATCPDHGFFSARKETCPFDHSND